MLTFRPNLRLPSPLAIQDGSSSGPLRLPGPHCSRELGTAICRWAILNGVRVRQVPNVRFRLHTRKSPSWRVVPDLPMINARQNWPLRLCGAAAMCLATNSADRSPRTPDHGRAGQSKAQAPSAKSAWIALWGWGEFSGLGRNEFERLSRPTSFNLSESHGQRANTWRRTPSMISRACSLHSQAALCGSPEGRHEHLTSPADAAMSWSSPAPSTPNLLSIFK